MPLPPPPSRPPEDISGWQLFGIAGLRSWKATLWATTMALPGLIGKGMLVRMLLALRALKLYSKQ